MKHAFFAASVCLVGVVSAAACGGDSGSDFEDRDDTTDPSQDASTGGGSGGLPPSDAATSSGDAAPRASCGNAVLDPNETCDDQNAVAGDGCSDTCQLEPGWACPTLGAACVAAACGDGLVAGTEECDDGQAFDPDGGALDDGCSAVCTLQDGFKCETPGQPCTPTTCGDNAREGTEQCDDGNTNPYDGCRGDCTLEPTCAGGVCVAACGDGLKFPSEQCDDGNTRDGDGCSSTCTKEDGFSCEDVADEPPDSLELPVIVRDFKLYNTGADSHPDFEHYDSPGQITLQLVQDDLGADGNPVWRSNFGRNEANTADNTVRQLTGPDEFAQWYSDAAPAMPFYDRSITLDRRPNGTYVFESTSFFPVDGVGYGNQGKNHNFGFTSELRYWFTYGGGETLEFYGDDDVWVFINGKLAVDIGGRHAQESGSITLDQAAATRLGLTVGGLYEVDVFHAEVHTSGSNYKLTLGGFVKVATRCEPICGDGVKTRDEACDDGVNDGGYGQCAPGCVLGPRCGDGHVDAEAGEACDDGNLVDGDGCSSSCQRAGGPN